MFSVISKFLCHSNGAVHNNCRICGERDFEAAFFLRFWRGMQFSPPNAEQDREKAKNNFGEIANSHCKISATEGWLSG